MKCAFNIQPSMPLVPVPYMLLTRLCIARETASKFPVPWSTAHFLPRVIHSAKPINHFLVASSIQFCLLRAYGGSWGAQQWHQEVLTRSLRWTQMLRVWIHWYLCCYEKTWTDFHIANFCIGPPPSARRLVFLFDTIVPRHSHAHCVSGHCPIN